MNMRKGEKWICSNLACRCEFVVTIASGVEDGVNPRCCCGYKMKKVYVAPAFRIIQNPEDSKFLDKKDLSTAR